MRTLLFLTLLMTGLPAWSDHNDFCELQLKTLETTSSVPKDAIILGDSIAEMAKLPAASVDFVFADPPYNLQLPGALRRPDQSLVNAVDDEWDKFKNIDEYDKFTRRWLVAAQRVMKPNATIIVTGTYHNIFRIGAILQEEGFWILNDIIWRKTNPMPNFRGRRFTNAHETMIWAAKNSDSAKYTFNYETLKAGNEDCQVRSDWIITPCQGGERLRDDAGAKIHSTQKPEALLTRILLATTNTGDVVLDPFFGSGTTGAVAKQLRRTFIGIEKDPGYAAAATERIKQVKPYAKDVVSKVPTKRTVPRVAFASLIEAGLITAGEYVYDGDRKESALVRVDGTLSSGLLIGSIHKLCSLLRNQPSCNGWEHWYVERNGELILIDELRAQMRKLQASNPQ